MAEATEAPVAEATGEVAALAAAAVVSSAEAVAEVAHIEEHVAEVVAEIQEEVEDELGWLRTKISSQEETQGRILSTLEALPLLISDAIATGLKSLIPEKPASEQESPAVIVENPEAPAPAPPPPASTHRKVNLL